jgi:predicted nucleic acid-binding protein
MGAQSVLVLDASVGVKWFKEEPGREAALAILAESVNGNVTVAVPTHFVHEVLSIARRSRTAAGILPAWEDMLQAGIAVIPLTDEVVREAARQCSTLGCTFYDALAPACATLLSATLVSADARAHARYPGVRIIGE